MKTPKELSKEIGRLFPYIAGQTHQINIIMAGAILREFEKEIRQDQKLKSCVAVKDCFFNSDNATIVTKVIMEAE